MPRRSLLTPAERTGLLAFPTTDDDLIRHYTFSEPDLSVIRQRRGNHNRLGFAVQLCYLRYPGFALPTDAEPPASLLNIVGRQLRIAPDIWPQYAQRPETRREHLLELQAWLKLTPFAAADYRRFVHQLAELAQHGAEPQALLPIRDPYIFEFLGLKPAEVMSESHLEAQLTEKLQAFLLELGHGFCFEARQKRILIGDEHFFVDLVFYHRILKCHVLVELKLEKFSHENLGQLNTYVNWYRRHMMTEGDNPPVGILLCTDKNHALVEYALAGMDNQLFVSKYLLELPQKEEMQLFIDEQLREVG